MRVQKGADATVEHEKGEENGVSKATPCVKVEHGENGVSNGTTIVKMSEKKIKKTHLKHTKQHANGSAPSNNNNNHNTTWTSDCVNCPQRYLKAVNRMNFLASVKLTRGKHKRHPTLFLLLTC